MISPWNICPLQATCGRTHRGKGRWAVRSGFQWHQDDWRRSQHQLHGKIPTVADSRRCSVCECVSVSGTVTVDLWFLQVEKTSDAVTPPLHLTVTYPHLSPRQNNLLYLTHVTTSPQVHKNTRLLYTLFYTHTHKKTSQIFLSFFVQVYCDAARWINPDKINPNMVKPDPNKESLSVFLLVSRTAWFSSSCSGFEGKWNLDI